MKQIFAFLIFTTLIFDVNITKAQNQLYTALVGDTVELRVTGANGTIQWQESDDSLAWADMPGYTDTVAVFVAVSVPGNFKYYRAAIFDSLCPNTTPFYSYTIRYKFVSGTDFLEIGDWFQGGRVFLNNGVGEVGITPTTDQAPISTISWGCQGLSVPEALSLSDGMASTNAIVLACPTRPIAASVCYDLESNGYDDWFLPALDQMDSLYKNRNFIGSYIEHVYWSGTEVDANKAFWVGFHCAGCHGEEYKNQNYGAVRCIRLYNSNKRSVSVIEVLNQPVTATFTTQPQTQNKCLGSSVTFSVAALGTAPISYQWKKGGVDISGATSNTFTKSGLTLADEGIYTCEVTNLCRTIVSDSAELKVINLSVDAGSDITFCNDTATNLIALATTNHPVLSGTINYSWSPTTALGSPDSSITTAQPLTNTSYIISVTDLLGCSNTDTIIATSKTPVSITTQPLSYNKCINSQIVLSVTAGGTPPFSYQWKKDNVDIPGATNSSVSKNGITTNDEGIYTCEVTNICRTIVSDSAELKVIQLSADAGIDTRICNGQDTIISVSAGSNHPTESGNYSYSWSPTDGLSASDIFNPNASPTVTIDYTIQVTDQIGCTATDVVNVLVQNVLQSEEICMVTIDTATWKNKIIWEKTSNAGTSSFNVYKEISTNVFNIIGNVQYDSSSFYIDFASNPESYGSKYKIAAVDTCGAESDLSPYHKTMNLVISTFGSTMGLSWTAYEDESGSFIPGQYYIYRGTSPSNMVVIDSIPGSFTSYNDNNVDSSYYYMVGVKKPGGCNLTKNIVLESFSNKKLNFSSSINDYHISNLSIYPNPANERLYIAIEETSILEILNIHGQIIYTAHLTEKQNNINISYLPAGVYTLRIKTDRGIAMKKLIKQ